MNGPNAPALSGGSLVAAPSGHRRARTVVYIEDNPVNAKLVETILEWRPDVRLLVAAQGGLGLELIREHQPSLVLLDLNLPDISGAEVLRRIRSEPETAEIPVVMLSGEATSRQVERLRRAGADDYLIKPFGFERFLETVDEFACGARGGPQRADAAEVLPVPNVLDPGTVQALHRLANRSGVLETVNAYLADGRERLAQIETAARDGDLETVAVQAHALAGASGSVGATALAGRCRALEARARQADLDGVRAEVVGMEQMLAAASAALVLSFGLDESI